MDEKIKLKQELSYIFDFLETKDFAECTVEVGDLKVTIKRSSAFANPVQQNMATVLNLPTSKTEISEVPIQKYQEIKSPMVGIFYRQAKPGAPVFVKETDQVQQGQVLCVIEAMKLFNEIESEVPGKIIKILVEDGAPVQYDQPLFWITHEN